MLGNAVEILRNNVTSSIHLLIQFLILLSDMTSCCSFSACFRFVGCHFLIFLHVPVLYLSMVLRHKGKHVNNKEQNRIITCCYIFINNS